MNKSKTKEIKIDMGMFFNFYFAERKEFSPLFRHLKNYATSKEAHLILNEIRKGTFKPFKEYERKLMMMVIETGDEEYKKIHESSRRKALDELRFLSTLSRIKYGKSMVGYIDTRNEEACTNLLCTIIDAIDSEIGVDLSRIKTT